MRWVGVEMTVAIPWFVMVAWLSYQHGFKQNKMPEPHYFLGATAAMSIAALIGSLNRTVGFLFAWALVAGVFVNVTGKTPSVPANSEKGPVDKSVAKASGGSSSGVSITPFPGGPTLGVNTDCTLRPGDTKLPGGFIWRPLGSGVLGSVNGQLIGPC